MRRVLVLSLLCLPLACIGAGDIDMASPKPKQVTTTSAPVQQQVAAVATANQSQAGDALSGLMNLNVQGLAQTPVMVLALAVIVMQTAFMSALLALIAYAMWLSHRREMLRLKHRHCKVVENGEADS